MVFQARTDVIAEVMHPRTRLPSKEQCCAQATDGSAIQNIRGMVRRFMQEELEESGFCEDFSDDESLLERVLDSLSILKLISFLGETFGTTFSEEDLEPERFETINRIVELVRSKISSTRREP